MSWPVFSNFILVFLVASRSAAVAGSTEPAKRCVHDSQDPFEPARIFTQGTFKGKCIDVSSVRPPQLLSEDASQLTVVGFYDQGKFWRAVVAKNAVERVLFQIVPFSSGVPLIQAAHTQLRFQLRNGKNIQLSLQSTKPSEIAQAKDVIISSTYTSPEGVEYDALKSFGGSFGVVTRFMSSYARGKEEIQKDKSVVRQFELRLTTSEMNQLFELALHQAASDGYSKVYDLFNENCTTIVFDTLDAVRARPRGVQMVRGSWWHLFDEFIEPSIQALRERHLIDDKSEVAPMNSEMTF